MITVLSTFGSLWAHWFFFASTKCTSFSVLAQPTVFFHEQMWSYLLQRCAVVCAVQMHHHSQWRIQDFAQGGADSEIICVCKAYTKKKSLLIVTCSRKRDRWEIFSNVEFLAQLDRSVCAKYNGASFKKKYSQKLSYDHFMNSGRQIRFSEISIKLYIKLYVSEQLPQIHFT